MKKKKKILIGDPQTELLDAIVITQEAKKYEITVCKTGPAVMHTIREFKPDLLVIDLMMPHIHGIEILKTIKNNPQTASTGVIITSFYVMIQNYHSAIEKGADYFLSKPFEVSELFRLIDLYFQEALNPSDFKLNNTHEVDSDHCYHPIPSTLTSYLRFWGTRGSNPVSGAEYIRFGGNTSCLEVRHNHDLVIIDAGTGIRRLGDIIDLEDHQTIHLFISHTHWDHITGFPFFGPLYKKNCNIIIWAPVGFEKSTKELFIGMLAYAYFPVRLDEMKASVTFKELRDHSPVSIGNLIIDAHFTNHPGPTVGFKIKTPTKTVAYITDNEVLLGYHGHPNKIHLKHPLLQSHKGLIQFLKECDLIIHEAQYFPEEYARKTGWGHSSIPNATVLIKYSGCKRWIVTHHDPNHKDRDLEIKTQLHEDIIKECKLDIQVEIAYDGLITPL